MEIINNHEIRIPIKQLVFHGKYPRGPFFVALLFLFQVLQNHFLGKVIGFLRVPGGDSPNLP